MSIKTHNTVPKNHFRPLIVFLVILLALIEIWASHRLSTNGEKLARLEESIRQQEIHNKLLKEEVLKIGSLSTLADKASQLGFTPVTHVLNLTSQLPVAFKY